MGEETKKRILIVDDDEFLLEMYAFKFKESGFDVEIAKNGAEALEIVKKRNNFTVMLLDIVMPSPDGFEVITEIKKNNLAPNTKIIALTNLGQKEDIEKGKKYGFEDYIVKARYTPSEVVARIKSLLKE